MMDDNTKQFIPSQAMIDYYESLKVIGSCPSCGLSIRFIDCIDKERGVYCCVVCRFIVDKKNIIPF